jgi:hypothetical protein
MQRRACATRVDDDDDDDDIVLARSSIPDLLFREMERDSDDSSDGEDESDAILMLTAVFGTSSDDRDRHAWIDNSYCCILRLPPASCEIECGRDRCARIKLLRRQDTVVV